MQVVTYSLRPGSSASLTGFLHDSNDHGPRNSRGDRPSVLVCPGGGYNLLAPHEAEPVAMQFYASGYDAFVLTYTVTRGELSSVPLGFAPLLDASAAVAAIRKQKKEGSRKVAVCGFSAGGHLAASLATMWNHAELRKQLPAEHGDNRPDAMILCYPAISSKESAFHSSIEKLAGENGDKDLFSLELRVGPETPPAFIWHTADDETVPAVNSLLFATALSENSIPFELHVFEHGAHGLSLCTKESGGENRCNIWMPLCIEWLDNLFKF